MDQANSGSFPFDALDAGEDFNIADLFPPGPSAGKREDAGQAVALTAIRRKLQELDDQLRTLITMLDRELAPVAASARPSASSVAPSLHLRPMSFTRPAMTATAPPPVMETESALRTIEGVFDGQNMVGPDGKQYSVPANYASKSKLVEGDILKLTITARGAFVYKQIVPIPRDRRIGILECDDLTHEYVILITDSDDDRAAVARAVSARADLPQVPLQRYRVLRASITYYRGSSGDEVVVLVPRGTPSTWGAVENIIKR